MRNFRYGLVRTAFPGRLPLLPGCATSRPTAWLPPARRSLPPLLGHDADVSHEAHEQLDHARKLPCRLKPTEGVLHLQRSCRGGVKHFQDRRIRLTKQGGETRLEVV